MSDVEMLRRAAQIVRERDSETWSVAVCEPLAALLVKAAERGDAQLACHSTEREVATWYHPELVVARAILGEPDDER